MTTRMKCALFGLLTLFFLGGCQEKEEGLGRFGMLDDSTPEYTAVAFLRGIYEDDNLDFSKTLASKKMKRILTRYHTNGNVQRHLLNLKYDTVTITPQSAGSVGRSEFADKSTVTIFLSGMYNDNKVEDLRSLNLIKEGGDWKVNEIEADTYL